MNSLLINFGLVLVSYVSFLCFLLTYIQKTHMTTKAMVLSAEVKKKEKIGEMYFHQNKHIFCCGSTIMMVYNKYPCPLYTMGAIVTEKMLGKRS